MQIDPTAPGRDSGATVVTPLGAVIVCIALAGIFFLPRKWILAPILVVALFIPLEQRVVVLGLNFMMLRIMILAGWLQVLCFPAGSARHAGATTLTAVDKAVLWWAVSMSVAFIALWANTSAVVNRLGFLYDTFGIYFLQRRLCARSADVNRAIRVMVLLSATVAVCMVNEQMTGYNLFSVFGGVPEFTAIREGKLRSQGAFQHPILAGCFGAALMPLCASLWCHSRGSRPVAAAGILTGAVITITSSSSTPMLAAIGGAVAFAAWPLRNQMRRVRWGIAATLLGLHMVMNGPVWSLINKVSVFGGSSSYHRYYLVDQFIVRVGEWALAGTADNASWGLDTWDVANHYVYVGTRGGLVSVILFIAILSLAFARVGQARAAVAGNLRREWRWWALGAALFAHMVAFYGVSYDSQTAFWWYLLLAFLPAASRIRRRRKSRGPRAACVRTEAVLQPVC